MIAHARSAPAATPAGPSSVGRCARLMRGRRKRLLALAIVAALGGGVIVTHSALAMDHMGDGAGMCVAVLDAGLLATGAALMRRRARPAPARHPAILLKPAAAILLPPLPAPARSRAGPAALQVFRS